MIKKFIDKLLGKSPATPARAAKGKRVEVEASDHGIDLGLVPRPSRASRRRA